MAIYRIRTTVVGVFTDMDLALDGKRIQLAYDGDSSYNSTDLLELKDKLLLQWVGRGLSFQEWSITLAIAKRKPDGTFEKAGKWAKEDEIPQGGSSVIFEEIALDTLE